MSTLRRASWGFLILLLALSACRRRAEEPEEAATAAGEVETEAVANELPAGAAVVVAAHDLEGFWTRLESTQLWTQLRAIPQVDSLLDPNRNPQLGRALQQFQSVTGAPLSKETLFKLLGEDLQLGVYPAAAGDTTGPRIVLVADMEDRDALASMLTNLRTAAQGEGARFATETYRGVEVTVVSSAAGEVRGLYGFHKEQLVAASDQAGLQAAVDALDGEGETMAADTLYARALARLDEAAVTFFVRQSAARDLTEAMMAGAEGADTAGRAMLDVVDRYSVQSATAGGAHWAEDGLRLTTYTHFDPAARGAQPLREMLGTPPSEVAVVGYFPDSTLAFLAVNFLDAPALYDFARAYARDAAGAGGAADAGAQMDSAIAAFEARSGMRVREDILGWMGREAALGLNGVVRGGFFPVPELALAVQAEDPERARAFFQMLEANVAQAVQQSPQGGFPVQFQSEEHQGVTIRFAPTPLGEGLTPAWAVHEGYAVVALARGTLRRMLDARAGGAPAVTANPQFQALGGFLPDRANVVGYANTAQLLTEVGAAFTTFQQMAGQAPAGGQDTWTRVLEALKNLQAVGTYAVGDREGLEQRFLARIQ